MWKNVLNRILNVVMVTAVIGFICYAIYSYLHYRSDMEIYTTYTVAWYTDIWVCGIFIAAALLLCAILKFIIWKLNKK